MTAVSARAPRIFEPSVLGLDRRASRSRLLLPSIRATGARRGEAYRKIAAAMAPWRKPSACGRRTDELASAYVP